MSNAEAVNKEYEVLLMVLSNILIEIRAADNLKMANDLADIFHNVPSSIAVGLSPAIIEERLFLTASRLQCEKFIASHFEVVRNRKRQ